MEFHSEKYNNPEYQKEMRNRIKNSEANLLRTVLDKDPIDSDKQQLVQEFRKIDEQLVGNSEEEKKFALRAAKKKIWDQIKEIMSVDDFKEDSEAE